MRFLYLTTNGILYKNQFRFEEGHTTEDAIIQLTDQINNIFEKNLFTLGIFIDTVDYSILIKKSENFIGLRKAT